MRSLFLTAGLLAGMSLLAQPPTPRHSPEFVLTFNDGSTKLLSSYHGKVVCVVFLFTTCPHCQHASQVLSKLYTEYGSRGFEPIGVAWNEMSKMLVPDFVKSNNVNFPIAYSDRDKVMDYLSISPMMRSVVPQIVWIDRSGTIRSQTPAAGEESMLQEKYWREQIETLTAEHPSSAKKAGRPTAVKARN
ncbi:MAG: TlpA family protein disulfide reductase [Acidobacteriaceae bacterium]|nr:TlpA family protein disulfide reductase [Acidobacteriaceae bacterium]